MEKIICVFGDSITFGSWDPDKGGWVSRLRSYIESKGDEVTIYNCGVSGDNTIGLLKRFKIEAIAREPTIILFAIGINDSQYNKSKNNPRVPINVFQGNLQKLLNQAKDFTSKVVFVGLTKVDESKTMPIPWGPTKYYDEENVCLYDSKIKEIADKNKFPYIKMFDLLGNKDLEDGLHPNSEGHHKIFLKIKDTISTILK